MATITNIRRTVLPENVFNAINKYMHGDYVSLHILAVDAHGSIEQITAGHIPETIKNHDTKQIA